jgi:hypothetical protein
MLEGIERLKLSDFKEQQRSELEFLKSLWGLGTKEE